MFIKLFTICGQILSNHIFRYHLHINSLGKNQQMIHIHDILEERKRNQIFTKSHVEKILCG